VTEKTFKLEKIVDTKKNMRVQVWFMVKETGDVYITTTANYRGFAACPCYRYSSEEARGEWKRLTGEGFKRAA